MSNNRLPTYEPSVAIQEKPTVDFQSPAQNLINSFSHFASAVSEGEQMVAKPIIENQRAEIRNQIAKSYSDFSVTAMQNPDKQAAVNDFNQSSQKYATEYLQQVHFWNRGYAKNMLDYFADTHRQPIINAALHQTDRVFRMQSAMTQQDMTTQVLDSIENSQPQYDQDGNNLQFQKSKALMADQFRKLQQDYINGYTNEEVIRNTIPSLTKTYNKAMAVRGYKDALEEGTGQKYIQDFNDAHIDGLNDQEKASLINGSFKLARDQYFNSLGISLKSMDQQKKDMLTNIEKGGQVNTLFLNAYKESQTPEAFQDLEKNIVISQAVHEASQRFAMSNPAQTEAEVEQYRPTNPDDPNYKYQDLMYKKIKSVAASTFKDLYDDPMSVAQRDPAIQKVMADWTTAQQAGAAGSNFKNSPYNSQETHPDYALSYYQERRGLTLGGGKVNNKDMSVRFLTDAQAKSLVANINMADPRQKLQIFQALKDQSANQSFYNARIQQLVRSGMNPQLATAANVDPTSPYAPQIVAALSMPLGGDNSKTGLTNAMKKAYPDDLKAFDSAAIGDVYGTTSKGLFSSRNAFTGYLASISSYAGGNSPEFKQQMLSSIKNLGYYAMLNGIAHNSKDALNWAENVIAEKYQITSMNGQQIRIPKQYTPDTIQAYADYKQDEVKDFPFVVSSPTVDAPSRKSAADLDREMIMKGHWANDPLDHGLVWVDMNGKMRVDKNGKPLMISFDEAQNWHQPTSPLYKLEHKIVNTLMGNSDQPADNQPVQEPNTIPEKTKRQLDDVDHEAPLPQSQRNAVQDVMNNNIPAFKQPSVSDYQPRANNVYDSAARGIRNNNPGNIIKTANRYPGEVEGDDRVFKTFKTPEDGIRAMSTVLKSYAKNGVDNIVSLVRRWSDDNRGEYAQFISRKLGIDPYEKINLRDKSLRGKIMKAIIEFENGHNPYGSNLVESNA